MDANRTFYIKGDFIAEQHVATQNVYLTHDAGVGEHLHDQSSRYQDAVDVDFEEIREPQTYCTYISLEGLKRVGVHTPQEFEEKLRQACEQDAPHLAEFLKKNHGYGYLDFHGDGAKKILATLQTHFPTMRKYSSANFSNYFTAPKG